MSIWVHLGKVAITEIVGAFCRKGGYKGFDAIFGGERNDCSYSYSRMTKRGGRITKEGKKDRRFGDDKYGRINDDGTPDERDSDNW